MRELYLFPIPNNWWSLVPVDLILKLPDAYGYNSILVIVDGIGKQVYFIFTTTTYTTCGATNLYQKDVWKLHSLLAAFVYDQGLQVIVEFTWEPLLLLLLLSSYYFSRAHYIEYICLLLEYIVGNYC